MSLEFDLYPRANPIGGAKLVTFAHLQQGEVRKEWQGTGSGRIALRGDIAEAQFIDPMGLQYVRVRDTGVSATVPVAGFFTDNGDFEALTRKRTRLLTFGGAGPLSILARAAMDEQTYLDSEGGKDPTESGMPIWNLHLQGTWIGAVPHSLGAFLHRVMRECTHADRPRQPLTGVTWDFDASTDSNGTPWPAYEGEFIAQIGESVLSIVQRLMQLGLIVDMDPHTFELHAYVSKGTDRSGGAWGAGVVRFQTASAGTVATGNIKSEARRGIQALVKRSHLLVGSQLTWSWIDDPAADIVWEGSFAVEPGDAAALTAAGDAQLAARSDAGDTARLRIAYGNNPTGGRYRPITHLDVGDTATIHSGSGAMDWDESAKLIAAITWQRRRGGASPDVFLDFGSTYRSFENRQFQVGGPPTHTHPPNPRLCDTDHGVETSIAWKMATTGSPPAGWHDAGFDDSAYANALNVSHPNWYDTGSSRWIWDGQGDQPSGEERSYRTEFILGALPKAATLVVSTDNGCEVRVNGTLVATLGGAERGGPGGWDFATASTVTIDPSLLVVGANCISIIGWNETNAAPGPAGVYVALALTIGGTSHEAARCDHPHLHNELLARDVATAHPASAVTETTDGDVQTAINLLRARAWKQPVRAATSAAGTLASSFENGDTIDGVVLATGDRILLKDQAAGAENGIYMVNASGAPTRASDMDASSEVLQATVPVSEGTANADKVFRCTTNAPITLGTTALVFTELSGGGSALTVEESDGSPSVTAVDKIKFAGLTVADQGSGDVLVSLPEGASAKASATADLAATTGTAADVTGATLSLDPGTYIVIGNFDVSIKSNADRLFEGILDVGGTDENDLAVLQGVGLDTDDRSQVVQVWRVVLGSTTTVKLQARHSGGAAGDFAVNAANTTLTAYRAGAPVGVGTAFTPTLTASTTNPTLGTGGLAQGRYIMLGPNLMWFSILIQFGTSGTNAGSGTYSVGGLPKTTRSSGMNQQTAVLHIQDAGTTNHHGVYRMSGGSTGGVMSVADVGNPRDVTHAVPLGWGANDFINITGTVEVD